MIEGNKKSLEELRDIAKRAILSLSEKELEALTVLYEKEMRNDKK